MTPKRCWALLVNPIQWIISKIKNIWRHFPFNAFACFILHNGHWISQIVYFFLFLYVIIRVINSRLKCLNLSVSMDIGYFTLSVRFTPKAKIEWMNVRFFWKLRKEGKKTHHRPHLRNAKKWWLLLKIQLISVITAICSIMSFLLIILLLLLIGYK